MVGRMNLNTIEVRQGDNFNIILQVRDKEGEPISILDGSVLMQVRNIETNALIFSINGDIIPERQGVARIKITPKHSKYEVGNYATDIQVTMPNDDIHTIFPKNINQIGTFRITRQVSKEG